MYAGCRVPSKGSLGVISDEILCTGGRHRTVSGGDELFSIARPSDTGSIDFAGIPEVTSGEDGTAVPIGGEREFRVQGRLQDNATQLNLRLRILQPDGEGSLCCTTPHCFAQDKVEALHLIMVCKEHGDVHTLEEGTSANRLWSGLAIYVLSTHVSQPGLSAPSRACTKLSVTNSSTCADACQQACPILQVSDCRHSQGGRV